MTFNPTPKRQREFVEAHLNGGSFPDHHGDYRVEAEERVMERDGSFGDYACFSAMLWLDESNIKTLAEAWEKCPRADWLAWMYQWLSPSKRDLRLWLRVMQDVGAYWDRWQGETCRDVLAGVPCWDGEVPDLIESLGWIIRRATMMSSACRKGLNGGADEVRARVPNPWLPKVKR